MTHQPEQIRRLQDQLRPGYSLVKKGPTTWLVVKDGEVVRNSEGIPLVVMERYTRQAIANLQEQGIVYKARTLKRESKPVKPPAEVSAKNPLLLAREILRDPQSTGRERTMARGYITAAEDNEKMRELVQKLGLALREHQTD